MTKTIAAGLCGLLFLPVLLLAAVTKSESDVAFAATAAGDRSQLAAAPAELRGYFLDAARRYAIPPALLVAIATVESGFDPTAVGVATPYGHAKGMMQFLDSSWALFNVVPGASPFDPQAAVLAAANHLLSSGRLEQGGWDAARAVFGYNHDTGYVVTVLGWAARYGYTYSPDAPPLNRTRYRFPVRDRSADVEMRHGEVRIAARPSAPVVACVRGELRAVSAGAVTLRGEDGWLYHYRHAAVGTPLRVGTIVEAGDALGRLSSRTGRAWLTLAISRGDATDRSIDSLPYLREWQRG